VKKNREDAIPLPEAASEESVAGAELRAQVARQQLRLAKERLKRARRQFKDAKREAKSLRKLAAAEQRAWRRAMRKNKKTRTTADVAPTGEEPAAPSRKAERKNERTTKRRATKRAGHRAS
jgi:hypothetical protein